MTVHDAGVLSALAGFVAPPLCGLCAEPCERTDALCRRCERRLAGLDPVRRTLGGGLEVVSAAPYEGVARELVRRLKFSSRLALARVAAERMARAWGAGRAGWLVEVPPAPARECARGFDPAYLLARLIAERAPGVQVAVCLERSDGPRQVGRPRAERRADPPRIRAIGRDGPLPADDLWLVDDVVTTGATLEACARALREGGANRVRALTFAAAK